MPRLARNGFPGIPHHITQRGNRREEVFFTDDDRQSYLNWLKEYSQEHQVDVLASPNDQSYSFGCRTQYRTRA
jgi:putative transposase